jgi:hypothetical protein
VQQALPCRTPLQAPLWIAAPAAAFMFFSASTAGNYASSRWLGADPGPSNAHPVAAVPKAAHAHARPQLQELPGSVWLRIQGDRKADPVTIPSG